MRKIIAGLVLAASAIAAAVPASAQFRDGGYGYDARYDRGRYGYDARFRRDEQLARDLDRIAFQIGRGQQTGHLTPREADRLRREHARLWRVAQRYQATGGLDGREAQELRFRVADLRQQLRFERRDDDRRRYWR